MAGRFLSIVIIFIILSATQTLHGKNAKPDTDSTFNIHEHTMALPTPGKPFSFKHQINIELVSLPKEWLESSVNIPFPGYKGRWHLPVGFAIDFSVQSIIISNQIKLGGRYLYTYKQLHAGIGFDGNLGLGWLNGYGFDNALLRSFQIEPNLAIGIHFDNLALTLEGRYRYLYDYKMSTGSVLLKESKDVFNGFTLSLNIEQRLTKSKVVQIGIAANYARFHILAWPVFNSVKEQYAMPQFNIGLNF